MYNFVFIFIYIIFILVTCVCVWMFQLEIILQVPCPSTRVLHWLRVLKKTISTKKFLIKDLCHRWGQSAGFMHFPLCSTKFAGQWQPATHGLVHGPISFQFSHVFRHPGPQVSYTAPCLHWVAGRKQNYTITRHIRC